MCNVLEYILTHTAHVIVTNYRQGKGKKTSYKPQRKSLVMWSIPHFPPTGATDLLQKVELKDPFETSDDGIP